MTKFIPDENGLMPCGREHDEQGPCRDCEDIAEADEQDACDQRAKDQTLDSL